jgi:hypothetical protein
MVDLGLYNFVKNKRDAGESKEQVLQELANSGWNAETIEEAWKAVEHNKIPTTSTQREVLRPRYDTGASVGILMVLLVIIAGYFAFTAFENHVGSLSLSTSTNSTSQAVNGILFYPYTQPDIGVTMNVPSDWNVTTTDASDGSVNGFTTSTQSNSDTLMAGVTLIPSTQLLSGVVTERGSALSANSSVHMIQDTDMTIGSQPGHIFEYTMTTGGKTTHLLEGYVLDKTGDLFEFSASGPDADWSQIPALAMVNSISFSK